MKKTIVIFLFFIGFSAVAQEPDFAVKAEVVKNIKISASTRDSYVVPASEIWHVELTDGTKWKNDGGSGWVEDTGIGGASSDLNLIGNTLSLTNPSTPGNQIDLTPYLDNKNIVSASLIGNNLTLTLSDASTVVVDISGIDTKLSDSEVETAYNNQVPIVPQLDAEAGTSTTPQRWTPERVKQAIDALAPGTPYTAGVGLNLSSNQFSVDTTRVLVIEAVSPDLGPFQLAIGTNSQLDALPPAVGFKRLSFATDGGGGTVLNQGDMFKSTYDTNENGIVDNSETVGSIAPDSFLRSDGEDRKTSGNLIFEDDIRVQFGTTANSDWRYNSTDQDLVLSLYSTGVAPDLVVKRDGTQILRLTQGGNLTVSGNVLVSDEPYGPSFNGSLAAVTKNAFYDKMESLPLPLTTEEVQDIIGAMVTGNSENQISVSYNDVSGKLDFDVAQSIAGSNPTATIDGTGFTDVTSVAVTYVVTDKTVTFHIDLSNVDGDFNAVENSEITIPVPFSLATGIDQFPLYTASSFENTSGAEVKAWMEGSTVHYRYMRNGSAGTLINGQIYIAGTIIRN